MRTLLPLLGLALTARVPALIASDKVPTCGIVAKFAVGGEGGWDYLTIDSDAHRLYISRGTRVTVVNTATGRTVGEILDTPGVHGIAIVTRLGRGYTSNGRGTVPWRWPCDSASAATGRPYRGVNVLHLGLAPYRDNRWLTLRQTNDLGGSVRKGESASLAVFGSGEYGHEELVAELASAFCCAEAELDNSHVVYAAAQAQKAADWIKGACARGEAR